MDVSNELCVSFGHWQRTSFNFIAGYVPCTSWQEILKWQFDRKKCVQIHLFTTFYVQVSGKAYWTTVFALEVSSVEEMQCIENLAKRVRHYCESAGFSRDVIHLRAVDSAVCLPCLRCQMLTLRSVTVTWRTSDNHSLSTNQSPVNQSRGGSPSTIWSNNRRTCDRLRRCDIYLFPHLQADS